jgi:hypothetical protein
VVSCLKYKSFSRWGQLFSLDKRSLAFFRVTLGLIVLCDLFSKLPLLKVFHSDQGVLLRQTQIEFSPVSSKFSLFFISGEPWFAGILFLTSIFFALTFTLGYKTKLSTIICWVLAISIQSRNNLILSSADTLLRLMLLWSVFLPVGARFSIDHAFKKSGVNEEGEDDENLVSGLLVLPFTFQMGIMYVFTALLKWRDPSWTEGTAPFYALGTEDYLTSLGVWVAQFVEKHSFFAMHTIYYEIIAGVLLVFTSRLPKLRFLTIITLIMMHLAFDLFFEINFFSWICIFSLMGFIPGGFWDWCLGLHKKRKLQKVVAYYDRDCGFCRKLILILREFLICQKLEIHSTASDQKAHNLMEENNSWVVYRGRANPVFKMTASKAFFGNSFFSFILNPIMKLVVSSSWGDKLYEAVADNRSKLSIFTKLISLEYAGDGRLDIHKKENKNLLIVFKVLALLFTIYILMWNLNHQRVMGYKLLRWVKEPGFVLRLDQSWRMFVTPSKRNGWIVTTGKLRSGQEVDPLREIFSKPTLEKPQNIHDSYPSYRWKKYFKNLRSSKYKKYRRGYGKYICRNWNSKYKGDLTLEEHEMILMSQTYDKKLNKKPIRKSVLWRHWCFKKPKDAK